VLGVLAIASMVAYVSRAYAQPSGHDGHEGPAKAAHGQAGPHADQGPGKGEHSEGMRGMHEREHGAQERERGAGRDAGLALGHGGRQEAVQHRIDELEKKGDKLTLDEKEELTRLRSHPFHRIPFAKLKGRLQELQSKQDAGKLADGDQKELERLQKIQTRHAALEGAHQAQAQSRVNRSRDAKRRALQENPKVGKDVATNTEFTKYAQRMAKLDRAKELAAADEDTELVQKIDSLIAKEQQRHQAWVTKNSPSPQGAAQ